jgi:hypothetical protein
MNLKLKHEFIRFITSLMKLKIVFNKLFIKVNSIEK